MEAYAATTGAAFTACAGLCALLLAEQFLARGSARLLASACAFLIAAMTTAAGALLGLPAPPAALLWAITQLVLAAGLAGGAWGGPRGVRRRLADPALRRGGVLARALAGSVAAGVAVAGAATALPAVSARALGLALLPLAVGALAVVLRRGRRGDLERRLPIVAAALPMVAALEAAGGDARYAARAVGLAAVGALAAVLVHDLGRLWQQAGGLSTDRDPLTGVRTRTAAIVAAEALHGSRAPREPLAVALVALDDLGAVNDRFGQLAGDAVLTVVAGMLRDALRDEDVVGRYGGDVFMVALPGTDEAGALLALERALAGVRGAELGTWAHELRMTATAGVAPVEAGDRAIDAALRAADTALKDGQAAGGDRVVSRRVEPPAPLPTRRRAAAGPRAA